MDCERKTLERASISKAVLEIEANGVIHASLKLPDECGPTILDHTKQHCHNKRSMITPESSSPVIINSQCSSIKLIERSTKYVLPRIQVFTYMHIYIHIYIKKPQMKLASGTGNPGWSRTRLETWGCQLAFGLRLSPRSDFGSFSSEFSSY